MNLSEAHCESWYRERRAKGTSTTMQDAFAEGIRFAKEIDPTPPPEPPSEPGYEQPVPSGFKKVDAYSNGEILVVLGVPREDLDVNKNPVHNCDEMGCGSLDHTIAIISLNEIDWQGQIPEP